MAIELVGLDHVVLRVRDLDRALAFYCGVLGCREERRVPDLGLVQLRAGRNMIDLVDAGAEPPRDPGNMHHFAVRLARFDEAALRAHLQAHGVPHDGFKDRYGAEGDGPSVYVTDPDGNRVELKGPPPLAAW